MVATRENSIRKRASYAMWKKMAEFLEKEPTAEEILLEVNRLLNEMRAYGSVTHAGYSNQSLHLVIDEMKNRTIPKRLAYRFILGHIDDPQWGTLHLNDDIVEFLVEEDMDAPIIVSCVQEEVRLMMEHLKKVTEEEEEEDEEAAICV